MLDVGRSSRQRFGYFRSDQAKTLDINRFDDYPDFVDDICNIQTVAPNSFDGLVCMAVLEHVYDPQAAVANMHTLLKAGGYCLLYVPFIYRYHAPRDLHYQDYFRYSRDAIAYLMRDFSSTTIYPCLGRFSSSLHLFSFWKAFTQRFGFGSALNRFIDRAGSVLGGDGEGLQASGYYVWSVK